MTLNLLLKKVAKIGFPKSKDLCTIYITRYHIITSPKL